MSTQDHIVTPFQHDDVHPSGRLWVSEDYTDIEDRPADSAVGLANLGFILAALRRSALLWCTTAVIGLLAGLGAFVKYPAPYQASTSVLEAPSGTPGAITDDQAIAQSRTVAGLAISKLGRRQSAASLVGDYTVTAPTDRVLVITSEAASPDDAIRDANALASAFLTFQADLLNTQEQLVNVSLQQQIRQAQQQINSMSKQISQLYAQPGSSARLASLLTQRSQATTALTELEQEAVGNQTATRIATDTTLQGSQVLDTAALLPRHTKKHLLLFVAEGLLAGLALGVGIVVVRALISNRLRRRDEVAHALGAPVKLSVGTVRLSGWPWGRRGLAAAQSPEVKRIVIYLQRAVPPSSRGPASLALVPLDDMQVPAVCLVSLAVTFARQGKQVVIADLCSGAPAARLLGATDSGVQAVNVNGAHLVVTVPERDDVAPIGPLQREPGQAQANEPLAVACASADLLLTLASLDPSLGGEHLAGWARGAIAVVTAGQSTAERIHAAGELIRLAGMRLISGVLVGADKTDQSLGWTRTAGDARDEVMENGSQSDAHGFFVGR